MDQGIKYECQDSLAGVIRKRGSEDHDAVSALWPEGNTLDLGVSCNKCSRSHRMGEANLERAAHNSSYLSRNGLNDQSSKVGIGPVRATFTGKVTLSG